MIAIECLLQIAGWIEGNDWADWKTRVIPGEIQNSLLIQREINRYLFVISDDDLIRVYDSPTYDNRFVLNNRDGDWYIDNITPLSELAIKSLLEELELTSQK